MGILTGIFITACAMGTEADQRKVEASLVDWIVAQQSLSTNLQLRLYDAEANADPLSLTAPVSGTAVEINDILLEVEEVEVIMDPLPFGGILGGRFWNSLSSDIAAAFGSPLHAHGEGQPADGSVHRYVFRRILTVTRPSTPSGSDSGNRPYYQFDFFFSLPPGTVKQIRLQLKNLKINGTVNTSSFNFETTAYSDPAVSLKCSRSGRSGDRIQPAIVIDLSTIFRGVAPTNPAATISARWKEAAFVREHECYAF
jgi:hypothetical protein